MKSGLFVPLDVDFYADPKLIAAGPVAGYLYLSGVALAKRTLSDGFIADAQLATLTVGFPGRPSAHAQRLVEVGLWVRVDGGWDAPAFTKRNPSKQSVEEKRSAKSTSGAKGNHERWHVGPGAKPSAGCRYCVAPAIASDRTSETVGSPETEAEPKTEAEACDATAVDAETERRIIERRRRGHDIGPKLEALIRADVERDLRIQSTTEPATEPRWSGECAGGACGGSTFVHDDELDCSVPCPHCRPGEHADVRLEVESAEARRTQIAVLAAAKAVR